MALASASGVGARGTTAVTPSQTCSSMPATPKAMTGSPCKLTVV